MHAAMPSAARARRSSSVPTPPEAMTGTGVSARELRGRLDVRTRPGAVARDVRVEDARQRQVRQSSARDRPRARGSCSSSHRSRRSRRARRPRRRPRRGAPRRALAPCPARSIAAEPRTTRAAPMARYASKLSRVRTPPPTCTPGPNASTMARTVVALHRRSRRAPPRDPPREASGTLPANPRPCSAVARRTPSRRRTGPGEGGPPCRSSRSMAGTTIMTRETSRAARGRRAGSSPGETGKRRGCRARRR